MNRDQVLKLAALAAKWKEPAKDALDTMVLSTCGYVALLCVYDAYMQSPISMQFHHTGFVEGIPKRPINTKISATQIC